MINKKLVLTTNSWRSLSIDRQGLERQSLDIISLNSQIQSLLNNHLAEQFKQVATQSIQALKSIQQFAQGYSALQRFVLLLLKERDTSAPPPQPLSYRGERDLDKLRINTLLVQNNKLAIEIKQLSQRLHEIEESQDVVKLKQQLIDLTQEKDDQINRLIIMNDAKDKQVSKSNQLVIQLKSVIQKQDSQIQILENYLDSDKKKYQNIENTYDKLVNDNRKLREVCQMQEEDLSASYYRYRHYLREEAKSRKKLLMLQDELDRMKIEKSKRPEVPKTDPEQEQRLIKLMYKFAQDKCYVKFMKEIVQNNISRLNEQEQTTIMFLKHVRYDYIYKDSLNKFQYPRPSFLVFYESNMKILEQEYRNIEFHQVRNIFFATIRAILDSQFNVFNYKEEQGLIKFADFVYGWISNFQIDLKSRKIEIIKNQSYEHLEPIRLDFLLDCLSPKVACLNEVKTFNELLFEQSSNDELYYYLHCRFLIYQGNLQNQSKYSFEAVMFVQLNWVTNILETILWKYDQNLIQSIKQVIMESSVTKCITQVDGHYVLRILLELYRNERKNRLSMLKEVFSACMSVQSNGKSGVTYKNFKKIFSSNFPDVGEAEICSLFRESYLCGEGIVTAESFFTAASESCFFVKQMLLKSVLKMPVVELNDLAYKESNIPFLDFYGHYKLLPHHLVMKCCEQFGLQSVMIELDGLNKLIKSHFQDQYNQYSLYGVIARVITIYNSIISLQLMQRNTFKQDWDQTEIEAIKQISNQLSQLLSPLIEYEQQDKLQMIVKQRKLRPLQNFIRRRVQKFYLMVGNLINNNNISIQDPQFAKRRYTKQSSIKMQ